MGFNTTVVIRNDMMNSLRSSMKAGEIIVNAADRLHESKGEPVDFSYGNVIETHHADGLIPILSGGNTGRKINDIWIAAFDLNPELTLLKSLAEKHNYRLVKKK